MTPHTPKRPRHLRDRIQFPIHLRLHPQVFRHVDRPHRQVNHPHPLAAPRTPPPPPPRHLPPAHHAILRPPLHLLRKIRSKPPRCGLPRPPPKMIRRPPQRRRRINQVIPMQDRHQPAKPQPPPLPKHPRLPGIRHALRRHPKFLSHPRQHLPTLINLHRRTKPHQRCRVQRHHLPLHRPLSVMRHDHHRVRRYPPIASPHRQTPSPRRPRHLRPPPPSQPSPQLILIPLEPLPNHSKRFEQRPIHIVHNFPFSASSA
jgi:hypothetical protein